MVSRIFSALLVNILASPLAFAWFHVPCGAPLIDERLDPIVSPGALGSNHAHTVHGSNGFSPNSTYESLRAASCSSCQIPAQDKSAYWFPKLYFKDPVDGHYEDVPNQGLLVYYLNRGDQDKSNGGPGLKAFPPGFQMVSGSAVSRSIGPGAGFDSQAELAQAAIQYSCLRYNTPGQEGYNGYGFPNTTCEAGYNARVQFPSCWDGVNLDSPDHTSHVAYLSGLDNGACPSTHPVGLMHIMFEITWDVDKFASRWTPPNWPFVYATGDPTGFSEHGDFQNGWDQTALQNAIDNCNNPNDSTGSGNEYACPYLTVVDASVASQCQLAPVVNEQVNGNLTKLPGCNPIQPGPQPATIYSTTNCPI